MMSSLRPDHVPSINVVLTRNLVHQEPGSFEFVLAISKLGCFGSLHVPKHIRSLADLISVELLAGCGHDPICAFWRFQLGSGVWFLDPALMYFLCGGYALNPADWDLRNAYPVLRLQDNGLIHFFKFILGEALLSENWGLLFDYLRLGAVTWPSNCDCEGIFRNGLHLVLYLSLDGGQSAVAESWVYPFEYLCHKVAPWAGWPGWHSQHTWPVSYLGITSASWI